MGKSDKHISQKKRLESIRGYVKRSIPGYGDCCHDDMADLLDEVELLNKENFSLQSDNESLFAENIRLKAQINYLLDAIAAMDIEKDGPYVLCPNGPCRRVSYCIEKFGGCRNCWQRAVEDFVRRKMP